MDHNIRAIFPGEERALLQDGSYEPIVRIPLCRTPKLQEPRPSTPNFLNSRPSTRVSLSRGETILPDDKREHK